MDFGLRRLGLAVSDPGETIATPLYTLSIASVRDAPAAVARAAREVDARAVVVGVPEGLDGEEDRPQVLRVRRFARALRRVLALPVHLVDESLSSREAAAIAGAAGGPRREEELHAAAAAVILQRWLNERGPGARRGPAS